ncbi:hypothetical protein [Streptomyces sp. NPDC059759]
MACVGLGSGVGLGAYAAVPLPACLLWLPVLLRGARVTSATENLADQRAS